MQAIAQHGKLNLSTIEHAGPVSSSKKALWAGRIMSGLAILFMTVDALGKVFQFAPYVQGSTELGFPLGSVLVLGLIELVSVVLYVIPRTSVLGAVLLTGWYGGAIATHIRFGHPLFSHTLFPIYFAILVWGGLALRRRGLLNILLGRTGA